MREEKPPEEPTGGPRDIPTHTCTEHRTLRSSGLDPRFEGNTWVREYECAVCGSFLGRESERLD